MTAEHRDAGEFGTWLAQLHSALRERRGMDVPCGDCNACCRSSFFIHIGEGEAARAAIPAELLFAAPHQPQQLIIGFDEHGRCPMLKPSGCDIYAVRPLTCQQYDCRIFPATGIFPSAATEQAIATRARHWRFSYANPEAHAAHAALLATGGWLMEHREALQPAISDVQLALLTVRGHRAVTIGHDLESYQRLWAQGSD
ncbi:MAG: YkgJ family cysteine cluster protein [Pseudomonadota bacterium]